MSDIPTLQLPPVKPPEPPDGPWQDVEPEPPGHRRAWRIALISAVAVLLLAVPLALVFILRGDDTTTGTAPTPPSVSAEPSSAPTSAGPSASGVPAPDGRIPRDVLRNATLYIPAWPVDNLTGPSGRLHFVNGEVLVPADGTYSFERHMIIFEVKYGDVDRDGAQETLASIGCVVQGGSYQLVAFDRDTAGNIVTLGTVVATTGEIRMYQMDNLRVRPDGGIAVTVGDYQRCCGDETPMVTQTRVYGWTGDRFRQISGPTEFPVNPFVTETSVQAGELVLGPAVDGIRRGTLTVTVGYVRGARPDHLALTFEPPPGLERDGTGWPAVRPGLYGGFTVDLPTPAKGATAKYTFAFRMPVTATVGEFHLDVAAMKDATVAIGESWAHNNGQQVTIRTAT